MEHLTVNSKARAAIFPRHFLLAITNGFLCFLVQVSIVVGASHWETEKLFFSGQYAACEQVAREEVERGVWNEQWSELLIECLLTRGRYEEAERVFQNSQKRYANRIALRMKGYEIYRMLDRAEQAEKQLETIYRLVSQSPWRYSSSRDQITLGRYFAIQGEDAREILDIIYDRVRKRNSKYTDVYIATAELALEKHDYQMAAENLEVAAKLEPENPHIFYLEARAWLPSDPDKGNAALARALKLNPRHVPSLLLQVDYLIDAERFPEAEEILEKVLSVNPFQPDAWAFHAVIAHLRGHYRGEQALRKVALSTWSSNHQVDHLIGRKLSQKYRFADGAVYQRRALVLEPDFLPAKFQLAQDLLRLGKEPEGWKLAGEVQDQDAYNVVAFNLMALKDKIERYETLAIDGFIVRMEAREAAIYGDQVLSVLRNARETLCSKYEVTLGDEPVIVEIFPRQQDFAIRTFGLPGGSGYLGVCFGKVITANSPASQGPTPSNWQAVLWHEFCHVVTLTKTNNRMPRWLSEGISVYEERQANPAWGQAMTPEFRQMILSDALTPVSELSGAFLRPPSPIHLQFAYFESSLVIEFILEKYGDDTLRRILVDLAAGMPIETALKRYIAPPKILDDLFAQFARGRANQLAPELDWDRSLLPEGSDPATLTTSQAAHPNNYWLTKALGLQLIRDQQWQRALNILKPLYDQFPGDTSAGNAANLMATAYRNLGDAEAEEKLLRHLAVIQPDAIEIYRRLMELDRAAENWQQLYEHAQRYLAVNPLLPEGHEQLALSAAQLKQPEDVIAAQKALLQMDPADPAAAHYQLSLALRDIGKLPAAKRQVLMALEAAPRYREAQRLLLELVAPPPNLESQVPRDE